MKTVIRVVAVVVLLILVIEVPAQSKRELKVIVDSVIATAKTTALNARYVNWDSVETEMHKKVKYAKTVDDLRGSFELLLVALKDRHGLFYNPVTRSGIAGYPSYQDPEMPSVEKAMKKINAKFDYKTLDGGVHYLKIASIPIGSDIQKEAEKIRSAIESLSKKESSFWIVDLRYAIEGDLEPMIAGMAPLLGEGLVATVIDGKKKIRKLYEVHNGRFYDNQRLVVNLPVFTQDIRNSKVAVLTSKYTAGGAEILSIAMKGKKNTRFFGERTAGQITGTNYVQINKDLVMSISDSQFHDRKGNSYKENVKPDSFITFTPGVEESKDRAITEAISWLIDPVIKEIPAEKIAAN